jgi:hypothetical protein
LNLEESVNRVGPLQLNNVDDSDSSSAILKKEIYSIIADLVSQVEKSNNIATVNDTRKHNNNHLSLPSSHIHNNGGQKMLKSQSSKYVKKKYLSSGGKKAENLSSNRFQISHSDDSASVFCSHSKGKTSLNIPESVGYLESNEQDKMLTSKLESDMDFQLENNVFEMFHNFSRLPNPVNIFQSSIEPLRGWNNSINNEVPWIDCRRCILCHHDSSYNDLNKQLKFDYLGRMISTCDGMFAHVNCLRWSDGVIEKQGFLEGGRMVLTK